MILLSALHGCKGLLPVKFGPPATAEAAASFSGNSSECVKMCSTGSRSGCAVHGVGFKANMPIHQHKECSQERTRNNITPGTSAAQLLQIPVLFMLCMCLLYLYRWRPLDDHQIIGFSRRAFLQVG
jgi:hypothetical protein